MVNKNNPKVLQQTLQLSERFPINLKNEKFSLAFGVTDDFAIFPLDPSIFSFAVKDIRLSNMQITEENDVAFEKCEENHFPGFSENFQSLGLFNLSCLSNNNNVSLKGYWDENEIQYLSISLFICKNNTKNSICQSQVSINEFFQLKYFEIYLIQNNFDMNDYDSPVSSKISTYYFGIELGKRTQVSNYIKKARILSDKNIIFSNYEEINSYVYETDAAIYQKSENQLFTLELYSSGNILVFQRNYQKLYDLIASLGGILNPLMIICSFIVSFISDWSINEMILMKLYSVKDLKNKKIKQIKANLKMKERKLSNNNEKKLFTQANEQNFFYFTLYEKIKFMIKPKCFFNKREKNYESLLKKSEKKLDLFEILLKIDRIHRFKYILFNENQKKILDALSKKCLSFSSSDRKLRKKKYVFDLSHKHKEEITRYISNITETKTESKIDKRLLEMIELK